MVDFFIYDYGCGAQVFFNARPQMFHKHGYKAPKWVVDRFHFGSHKDEFCLNNCNPSACPGIDYVNTEACEQLFSWLGKFKFQTAGMTISTYKYFLYMVILLHNEQILNP